MSEVIDEFGVKWQFDYLLSDNNHNTIKFYNNEIGEFLITKAAFEILKCISDSEKYKIPSLIYEQNLCGNVYSITVKDEIVQWVDIKYITIKVEEFLHKFPADFIEIQQRSLINLYNQYPEYGQEIDSINEYTFFAKNESELLFILESMKDKDWIDVKTTKVMGGGFIFSGFPIIKDKGWIEIEKTVKRNRKKQVFIAMKFKNMDNIYNAIFQAIEDAKFFPLRIDKKEHINQISSEIQYEISQSGLIVADVTGQNQGVYFEAGYAMGLNIPVIWTCNEKETKEIHFDTRQYNTILWNDENDLYEKLRNRIIAIMGLRENQGHPHA
jgi:nucleoside 2-deoxyribosyltransferase